MDFITPFIKWLLQNDYIKKNKLFLNAVKAEDNSNQIVTQQVQKVSEYIDGSVLYRVIFIVFGYKSVSYNQLFKTKLDGNENIADMRTIQEVSDFVSEQENRRNYPDFGDGYEVQTIYPQYITPGTPSIDNALAKYSIPIICEVLAYEKE